MASDRFSRHTHVAFSDESSHNIGRYRSLGLVTAARGAVDALAEETAQLLTSSSVHELKWSALSTAKARFAAEKIITWAVDAAAARRLAIDALVWDTQDARHTIRRRDDVANLHRMYYRLLSTTLVRPVFAGATWVLRPDHNGVMDWASVHDVLDNAGRRIHGDTGVLLWRRAHRRYAIEQIVPMDSSITPLVQVADLIAGLAAYSYESFNAYESWCRSEMDKVQLSLELPDHTIVVPSFSLSDRERCHVLRHLDQRCKHRQMGVSLATQHGLATYPPGHGVRFWLYRPQREADRAPVKGDRTSRSRQLATTAEGIDTVA